VPVDPWGPDIARGAKDAVRQILAGAKQLRDLGREVEKLQGQNIRQSPLAPKEHKKRK